MLNTKIMLALTHGIIKERSSLEGFQITKGLECADGFRMSVQASEYHMCEPKELRPYGTYESFEVGDVSSFEELLDEYDEGADVYGCVPADVINSIVKKHGGLRVHFN